MNAALRRMVRRDAPPASEPPLPARALRQAITRAADRAADLSLVVLGVEVVEATLDDLIDGLDPMDLIIMLGAGAGPEGVLAIDAELRGALIEMQTVGRLDPRPAPRRAPTTADLAMAEPFAHRALAELAAETAGLPQPTVPPGTGILGRFANPRAASLALPDQGYRLIRLSLDLGLPDRAGGLVLALPRHPPPAPRIAAPVADPAWTDAITRAVMDSPCRLDAVLMRRTLSLGQIEGFAIGQILPLPGVTVSSVLVEGPGGAQVATGKLGQVGGMRAVRLISPRPPQMEEMLPPPP